MFFNLLLACCTLCLYSVFLHGTADGFIFKKTPTPDGDRCGICPTYFQKICGFDFLTNSTFIFDNHCLLTLYNCIHDSEFVKIDYDHCIYFGNFAYVHGLKYEDMDYGEDHIVIKGSKKNPDFVSYD